MKGFDLKRAILPCWALWRTSAYTGVMDTWDCNFVERSPMFEPLRPVARSLAGDAWPALARLNELAQSLVVVSGGGQPLRFVSAAERAAPKAADYEQRIHDEGTVSLRERNWHDFFNAVAWLTYPRVKAALNRAHVDALRAQPLTDRNAQSVSGRNRRRDALTLFDESGVLVLSQGKAVLEDIRSFAWRRLFWDGRERFQATTQCWIVGHALYEKALSPYVGMTGHALLLQADGADDADLHGIAANLLQTGVMHPRDLSPLPVLGIPGWWEANRDAAFYDNTAYFRPGRMRQPSAPDGNQPGRATAAG